MDTKKFKKLVQADHEVVGEENAQEWVFYVFQH